MSMDHPAKLEALQLHLEFRNLVVGDELDTSWGTHGFISSFSTIFPSPECAPLHRQRPTIS